MTGVGPIHVLGPFTGALFVVSLRHGLWLFVLVIAALVVVLARRHVQEQRRWLPALAAVRAIASTEETGTEPLDLTAGELAVLSKGHSEVLDRAADLAHQEPDPRRWSVAIRSITVARDLLRRERVPGICEGSSARGHRVILLVAATGVALVAAVLTASGWWLIPLVVVSVAAMVAWTDWREERDWAPAIIAASARNQEMQRLGDDGVVAGELAALARGHLRVLRRAQRFVELWPGPVEDRTSASRRLALAVALLAASGLARAASRGAAAAWAATGVTIVATLVLTG